MERLRKFCTLISDDEPLFDLLPQRVLDIIYENRCISIKIKVDEGVKITKRFVRIVYCELEKDLKRKGIDLLIGDTNKRVSLLDYYQIVFPLECVLMAENCLFCGKEKFDAFCEKADERYKKYYKELLYIIHCACHTFCDLSKRILYTFKFDSGRSPQTSNMFYQTITLGTYPLKVRYAEINGERRPVIQTGEIDHQHNESYLIPTTVPLDRLHVNVPIGMKEVPVYVQQHAVNRIMQRACCVVPGTVPAIIHRAFTENRKIIREGDRYLVECYYYDIKIGYFVATLVDGMFVILTFLLITHSTTPEGRKLSQLTGLKREDMAFLAIDDLKTLINSDITYDERIAQIFVDAGCESILQMNFEVSIGYYDWLFDDSKQETEQARLIAEYIQLGDSDEEYFENN